MLNSRPDGEPRAKIPLLAPGLALVFDMDGVVVDSNPVHRQAWLVYNRQFGIETDEAMQQRMYGKHNGEIVRDFFGPGLSAEEVFAHGAAKEALYRRIIEPELERRLVPGVREFLARHAAAPLALATNAEPANVAFILKNADLARYFRVTLDGHAVRNPKPHPEVFLRAAELLTVPPADCIVFEDSHSGVTAARAAGMRTVGLRTTHADLAAGLLIDDFFSPELEPWLASQKPHSG